MDKIKYVPLVLLVLFSGKVFLSGSFSFESSLCLFVLGLIASYYEFKSQDRVISEFKKVLEEQSKLIEENKKELAEVKNHMSSFKLQTQFRQQKAL